MSSNTYVRGSGNTDVSGKKTPNKKKRKKRNNGETETPGVPTEKEKEGTSKK